MTDELGVSGAWSLPSGRDGFIGASMGWYLRRARFRDGHFSGPGVGYTTRGAGRGARGKKLTLEEKGGELDTATSVGLRS